MNLRYLKSVTKELHFTEATENQEGQPMFDLEVQSLFYSERKREFYLAFIITLDHPSEFKLDLVQYSIFETDEDISTEFMSSHFPLVNAPAIAFPFVRAMMSIITLNMGYAPIVLPSINFTKFNKTTVYVDGVAQPAQLKEHDTN